MQHATVRASEHQEGNDRNVGINRIERLFVHLEAFAFDVNHRGRFAGLQNFHFEVVLLCKLFEFCKELHKRGIKFMLSNSDVPEIRNLYQDFDIHVIEVSRKVNSNTAKRNAVNELAIINYDKDSGEILSS